MADLNPEWEISVQDVKRMLDSSQPPLLIDVRDPDEHKHCRLAAATLFPLADLPGRIEELRKMAGGRSVVCHCHHGGRSLRAAEFLRSQGIAGVKSMAGGIELWSVMIDPSVPRY